MASNCTIGRHERKAHSAKARPRHSISFEVPSYVTSFTVTLHPPFRAKARDIFIPLIRRRIMNSK
jgi:hypothetical protein